MQITATMVKELRERTGVGIMDCKKFLAQAQGDMDTAIKLLRQSGQVRASERSGRTVAEGVVLADTDNGIGRALLEVNCETDFVARSAPFLEFAKAVLQEILQHAPTDLKALSALPMQGSSVEEARLKLVAKVGENTRIRRFQHVKLHGDVASIYLHGSSIGVLVDMSGGDEVLARDIALHIAASRPLYVSAEEVPADVVEKEKSVLRAQAQQSGKPDEIVEKIVQGRFNKFLAEVTLLGQPFVKDTDQLVGKLLKSHNATVNTFYRFEVGEGIERKQENFAEEVKAQRKAAETD